VIGMRKRTHFLNLVISIATYGIWLPVWWWYAGPGGRREVPGEIKRGVISFFGFFIVIGLISTLYSKYQFSSKHNALSAQEKKLFQTLSTQYPRILEKDMVEAVQLPESLRDSYFQRKTAEFKKRDQLAEIERKKQRDNNRRDYASRDSGYDRIIRIYNAGIEANTTQDYLAAAMTLGMGCSNNRISDRSLCRRVENTLDRAVASGVRVR